MTPFARIRGNRQATPRNPEIIRVENHQGRSGIDYAPTRLNQFDQDTILRSSQDRRFWNRSAPPTPLTMKTGGTNEQQPVAWLRTATTPTRLQWTAALHTAGIWRATPVRLRRAATLRRQRLRCAPTTTEEKPHRPDSRARRGPGHRPGLRSLVVPRQGQPANRRSVRDRHHHAGVLADSQQYRPDPRQDVEINSPGLGNRGSPLDEDLRRRFKRFRHAPPRCPSRSMVSRP